MKKHTRKEFLQKGLTVAGSLLLSGGISDSKAEAKKISIAEHKRKPLPFDPKKLNGISEKLIVSHWENNYGGAVKTLNAVNQRLAAELSNPDSPPYLYGDLKKEQLVRIGSVILHELYFENLGGSDEPPSGLNAGLSAEFGDFAAWQLEFRKMAQALGGGSGWVILGYNTHFHKLQNYALADHAQNAPASAPLLILDMYEHSYHMDYGAAAARYVDVFFRNINWSIVGKRYERAKTLT